MKEWGHSKTRLNSEGKTPNTATTYSMSGTSISKSIGGLYSAVLLPST